MRVAIGSDHAGYALKVVINEHLSSRGVEFEDLGTFSKESCDYTDFGLKVAEAVKSGEFDRGILICGTGIGISIAANKVPGIRAAHCTDTFSAHASRQHNDANILALGERVTGPGLAMDIVDAFLEAEFEGGRHKRRVDKIGDIEKKYNK